MPRRRDAFLHEGQNGLSTARFRDIPHALPKVPTQAAQSRKSRQERKPQCPRCGGLAGMRLAASLDARRIFGHDRFVPQAATAPRQACRNGTEARQSATDEDFHGTDMGTDGETAAVEFNQA